jgi:hypothetical protein
LPPGLTQANPGSTLTISGTPTAAGTFHIIVSSTNICKTFPGFPTFDIIVADRLAVTTASLPDAITGVAYSQTLQATGGIVPYAWSVDASSVPLPAWLTLDSSGVLHGTPPAPATINFTAQVTDASSSQQSASRPLTLTVDATAVPPSINPQPADQTVTVGQTATFTMSASGTSPLSYQWQKNGTDIAGATAATYVTPATALADSGALFHVIVTNPAGSVTSRDARLTVNAQTSLAITTTSLPDGVGSVSNPYSAALQATGGVPPYTWSAVGLPPGLAVLSNADNTGTVLGSPGRGGLFPVRVDVSDSSGALVSKPFTLLVPCIYHTTAGQPANENSSFQGRFALRFAGFDASGRAMARIGSLTLTANTNPAVNNGFGSAVGVEDASAAGAGGASFRHDAITAASTYCLNTGRFGTTGTLTVVTATSSVAYSISTSNNTASLVEFDPVDNNHGSGALKSQTATSLSAPANYVFGLTGRDHGNGPASVAGVFGVDASLSGTVGEDDFNDPVVNPVNNPIINNSIVAGFAAAPDAAGRTTGTITATGNATATGEIDFIAYVVGSDAGGHATELFALSNGSGALPATDIPVLSGEILRQNVAQPVDAGSMNGLSLFYLAGVDPTDTTFERTTATVGIVQMQANFAPSTTGNIRGLEFDADIGGVISGPNSASTGTYAVSADGKAAITPPVGLNFSPIIYLSDLNAGVLLDTSPGAGLGRMFFHFFDLQNMPAFGLVGDFAPAAEHSTLGAGGVTVTAPAASTLLWSQDFDSPALGGLIFNSQSPSLPFTVLDALNGRFTAGNCPLPPASTDICVVGYGQYGSALNGIGDIVIDETSGASGTKPRLMFWGQVP